MYYVCTDLGAGLYPVYEAKKNKISYTVKLFIDNNRFVDEYKRAKLVKRDNLAKSVIQYELTGKVKRHLCLSNFPELDMYNDTHFILYPYYDYDLQQMINQQYFSSPNIVLICHTIHSITKCLHLLHHNGFCHRDIQPANIYYNQRCDEYRLGDLEMISVGDEPMLSTNQYAAPEVFGNWGQVANLHDLQLADVWSLGAVFYYMFSGECAFNFDDTSYINQLNTGYQLLDDIVNSMLIYNPNERISLEQILGMTTIN